ncbi:TerD family protein [Isoptericola sp. NEAU-Y5]|uniref:TerD family protein n=1 Tax=Isoptericola luteus TaxID=2879484 RepID=A0ABS7ZDI2_9MICO|nr:TerD family protein [Isoptericola sp. NEAU-Y5]MCA5891830.1 TerD family protein [Isoptericola sp. NEAU-Y5]
MAALQRGANVSLTREVPGLEHVVVGIAWDPAIDPALADNLRLAAILCGAGGAARSADDLVYFNQMVSADRSVAVGEDPGDADLEQIEVDLPLVPADVERIAFVLHLNEGSPKRRTLNQLKTCVVRVLDGRSGTALLQSVDLANELTTESAVVLGELYRHREHWKFRVVGQGHASGVVGITRQFGLPL